MSDARAKPIAVADELSAAFWAAAREHRLVVQRCVCGYYNHPPRRVCDACLAQELGFVPVSGRGQVYSFTVMHQRDVAGFEHEAPFVNLVVELDEQPMLLMVSNLPGGERERLRVGAPVEVYFESRDDDPGGTQLVIPQFRLAEPV